MFSSDVIDVSDLTKYQVLWRIKMFGFGKKSSPPARTPEQQHIDNLIVMRNYAYSMFGTSTSAFQELNVSAGALYVQASRELRELGVEGPWLPKSDNAENAGRPPAPIP